MLNFGGVYNFLVVHRLCFQQLEMKLQLINLQQHSTYPLHQTCTSLLQKRNMKQMHFPSCHSTNQIQHQLTNIRTISQLITSAKPMISKRRFTLAIQAFNLPKTHPKSIAPISGRIFLHLPPEKNLFPSAKKNLGVFSLPKTGICLSNHIWTNPVGPCLLRRLP